MSDVSGDLRTQSVQVRVGVLRGVSGRKGPCANYLEKGESTLSPIILQFLYTQNSTT